MLEASDERKSQVAFHSREEPCRSSASNHKVLAAEDEKHEPSESENVQNTSGDDRCIFDVDDLRELLFGVDVDELLSFEVACAFDCECEKVKQRNRSDDWNECLKALNWYFSRNKSNSCSSPQKAETASMARRRLSFLLPWTARSPSWSSSSPWKPRTRISSSQPWKPPFRLRKQPWVLPLRLSRTYTRRSRTRWSL